jgi:hypothetical protein
VLLPTPNPIKFAVDTVLFTTEPVPVNTLQLFVPVVNVTALTVALGLAPQMVCVNGEMDGLLVSGSTLIVAVTLLLGQVLPATFTATN